MITDWETILQKDITCKEVILEGVGIRVSIPEDSMSPTEDPLTLQIYPCFTGPFQLPEDCESASPAYLIKPSRRVEFKKDVTVEIHHYACLESEKDCDDMVFLSASTTPVRKSDPMYVFKEIKEAKGVFKPGCQVGEIALRHFCFTKVGKRRRTSKSSGYPETKKSKGMICILDVSSSNCLFYRKCILLLYKVLQKYAEKSCSVLCLFVPGTIYKGICTLINGL